jgi:hypothetical protein
MGYAPGDDHDARPTSQASIDACLMVGGHVHLIERSDNTAGGQMEGADDNSSMQLQKR